MSDRGITDAGRFSIALLDLLHLLRLLELRLKSVVEGCRDDGFIVNGKIIPPIITFCMIIRSASHSVGYQRPEDLLRGAGFQPVVKRQMRGKILAKSWELGLEIPMRKYQSNSIWEAVVVQDQLVTA